MTFQPMFCAKENLLSNEHLIKFPCYASPKIDGMRALRTPKGVFTRSMKRMANRHINEQLMKLPFGVDGELGVIIDGEVNFRKTQSLCRRHWGEPQFIYFVFDFILDFGKYSNHDRTPFVERKAWLEQLKPLFPPWVVLVEHKLCNNLDELKEFYRQQLAFKHEGICVRRPNGIYKFGRSSAAENYLMRMKERETDEAVVIGMTEEMENCNEAMSNELGHTKRSTHNASLLGKGSLGALICRSKKFKRSFKIGTGFSKEDRAAFYDRATIGKIAHYSYDATGGYDKPRSAVFKSFREKEDIV